MQQSMQGITMDCVLFVFEGNKSLSEVKIWTDDFQSAVKNISGNKHLKLTCGIWKPNIRPSRNKQC